MISHYCLPTTQIEKRLPVLTCILFALFSLLLQPVLSPGGEVPLSSAERKAKKQHIEKGIQGYRINIRKLQEGIVLQQAKVQSTEKDARNLIWELEQIDIELLEQLTKLQALEEQMAVQQELIRNKETELQQAVANKEAVKTHLQERIKAFYKMGKVGLANVAFSTESMPQLLSFRDSFSSLLAYDKSLIDTYRQSIVELQKSREALHLERIVLNDFITQETIEQARITETKNEKRTLLEQIKTQKELHEQAVREMEKAADKLADSLNVLKEESLLLDQGFLINKGTHPAPIRGEIIALFGQQRENRLGITGKSTGITLSVPGTNKVQAIYEGTIAYASYLHGYGNTIIIDHGYNYFSIITRVERLLKLKGDKVEQGDIIALTGDTATLLDDGIYFEIRHGSTPLDPLLWLDKTTLVLPSYKKTEEPKDIPRPITTDIRTKDIQQNLKTDSETEDIPQAMKTASEPEGIPQDMKTDIEPEETPKNMVLDEESSRQL